MKLEILKAYIKNNLANDFIRPSNSPARAPILFDKKLDSSLRLCVDYQGLNNLIIKNWYPLLLVNESLDRLDQARRFLQLNRTNAYHQMRIREGNEWKTVFKTCYSHFEYQVMPFRLTNTPATFQGYINKILVEKLDIFMIVYLNNILIYTESEGKDHVETVWWVLEPSKAFIICQPKKVSILPGKGEILRLHRFSSKHPNRRGMNQGHTWLVWAQVNIWYPSLSRICQLLSTIHSRI